MGNFKVYVFVYLGIALIRAVFNLGSVHPALYAATLFFDAFAVAGLAAFSWNRLLLTRIFWIAFLFPFAALQVWLLYRSAQHQISELLLFGALILPAPYALTLYAFKTNWEPQKKQQDSGGKSE